MLLLRLPAKPALRRPGMPGRTALVLWLFLPLALPAASPQKESGLAKAAPGVPASRDAPALVLAHDRGIFRILSNGQQIGTERFEINSTADGYRAHGEIRVKLPNAAEASETASLTLNRSLEVTSYERLQKSPKKASVTVQFDPDRARAHYRAPEGESDYEYYLERKVVVLDTNFFHHFTFLLQQYDFVRGGAQHISVFVPQEASPGMVLVEYVGKDEGRDKWVAKTEALEIHLWTDEARHLVKLAVPSAKVEVVREAK